MDEEKRRHAMAADLPERTRRLRLVEIPALDLTHLPLDPALGALRELQWGRSKQPASLRIVRPASATTITAISTDQSPEA